MKQPKTSSRQTRSGGYYMLALWTFSWLASLALAMFGPGWLWPASAAASWVALAVNVGIGIGWIVAHVRYLRRLDELQRKINLDALAIALGSGIVGGLSYSVAHSIGLVAFNDVILVFCVIVSAVYISAIAIGNLRYR